MVAAASDDEVIEDRSPPGRLERRRDGADAVNCGVESSAEVVNHDLQKSGLDSYGRLVLLFRCFVFLGVTS